MATFFRNSSEPAVGTSEVKLATSGAGSRFTIIGFNLTNVTGSIVLASIRLDDESTSTSTHFIKDVIIPPNQCLRAVNGGEKLIVTPSTSIYVSSNTPASLDVIMSYVEIV